MNIYNKIVLGGILIFSPTLGLASGKVESNPAWSWTLNNIILILAILTIIGTLFSLWNLMNAIFISKKREFLIANGIDPVTTEPIKKETFVSKWMKHLSGLVPLEKEMDIQLDHDYDGIKELDNSLPPWWLYGFYISIIVAIGYMYVYHYSDIGLSQQEEYEMAIEEGEKQKARYEARQANKIDEKNLIALLDEASLTIGMNAFTSNCSACHGQSGEGGVGPNLTDKYWLHGGSTVQIYKTIKNGVPEKGMIAWKAQMQPTTIHKIASYIKSLSGTNPPNAKARQGDLYQDLEMENDLSINIKR